MNIDEIMTFLETVNLQSISAAANHLFISQSSASNRIHHLEETLGVNLIHRAKGYKKINLTEEGEYFLPIAQQWMALYNDVKNISNLHYVQIFRITTNNILNSFLLPYIYTDFSNKYKNIMVYSQTEHSTEAHQHIANQIADLTIVYTEHYDPNVISRPLFKEDMVFLCHKSCRFAQTQQLSDLSDANEVYANWSTEFENWHHRQFYYFRRHKIVIGSATMFSDFLNDREDWVIVSRIVGDHIHSEKPDFITIEHPSLPTRTTYLLFHKYPKPGVKKLNWLFEEVLLYHLRNNPSITVIGND